MLLLATSKGILRLKGGGASLFPAEGLLDEEGRPRYERLLKALREAGAGRGAYLGLGPGFALLRLQPFPSLQGFSLEEAVLAEAERSPLFGGEELLTDYYLVAPEDERHVRVLYAALPKRAAGLLAGLRPARVEPLPLALWRYALAKSEGQTLLVVENLAHTVAFFAGGVLQGFRYLTLPADEGTPELAEEIARSLALFGHPDPVEEAWLLGLPEPPRVPPGLPAARVEQGVALDLEAFLEAPGPLLDLRPRRRALGEGLPREAQLAAFLAALFFALGLMGQSFFGQMAAREAERAEALRRQVDLLKAQAFQPTRPQGLGLEEVLKVAAERPETLWLTRLEAEEARLYLEGKALDPYAPLLLARRLGGKVGPLERGSIGDRTGYDWEVEVGPAQAR